MDFKIGERVLIMKIYVPSEEWLYHFTPMGYEYEGTGKRTFPIPVEGKIISKGENNGSMLYGVDIDGAFYVTQNINMQKLSTKKIIPLEGNYFGKELRVIYEDNLNYYLAEKRVINKNISHFTYEDELKEEYLWELASIRYGKIKDLIKSIKEKVIECNSDDSMEILPDFFCILNSNCSECAFGKVLGNCNDEDSKYRNMIQSFEKLISDLDVIINKIDDKVVEFPLNHQNYIR
jgi:hypothetical protein